MLSFLIWGLVLNVYAFIVTFITARMVIPKSERKREPKRIVAIITTALVPYMMTVLCLCIIVILAICKFDYEELKKFKDKTNSK